MSYYDGAGLKAGVKKNQQDEFFFLQEEEFHFNLRNKNHVTMIYNLQLAYEELHKNIQYFEKALKPTA